MPDTSTTNPLPPGATPTPVVTTTSTTNPLPPDATPIPVITPGPSTTAPIVNLTLDTKA